MIYEMAGIPVIIDNNMADDQTIYMQGSLIMTEFTVFKLDTEKYEWYKNAVKILEYNGFLRWIGWK